jgi:hypothetical protein
MAMCRCVLLLQHELGVHAFYAAHAFYTAHVFYAALYAAHAFYAALATAHAKLYPTTCTARSRFALPRS